MKKMFIVALFLGLFVTIEAQNVASTKNKRLIEVESAIPDSIQALLDDYDKITLPPLSVFLSSAEEHPSLQVFKAKVEGAQADKAMVNREWLNYVNLFANYQYGYNNVYSNYYSAGDPYMYDRNENDQHRYTIGVTVTIPLGNLLSQKYKRRKQQAILDELRYDYQMSLEERKLLILKSYNAVLEQLATIKVKAESAALYNAQMQIAEDDFINGKMSVTALSLERGRRSGAISTYQESKVALHNSITLLEMLTNITIMKK